MADPVRGATFNSHVISEPETQPGMQMQSGQRLVVNDFRLGPTLNLSLITGTDSSAGAASGYWLL